MSKLSSFMARKEMFDRMKKEMELGAGLVVEFAKKNLSRLKWNSRVGVVSRFTFFDGKCEWQLAHFGGRTEVVLIAHVPSTNDSESLEERESRFDYPIMGASTQMAVRHSALVHIETIRLSFDEFLDHFAVVHPEFQKFIEPFDQCRPTCQEG
ncbi:MAG TPA: hypothetical protein PLD99_01700 [Parcubacteria group bacterium]|nr:hypothetical protein [Parcubacteria group bacterium]